MALRNVGWIGAVIVVAAAGSHGRTPPDEPKTPIAAQALKAVPTELEALNVAGRAMYAEARKRELATIPVVIVMSGEDLVLRKNGKRIAATVIPPEYHALKCVAHSTLALFAHLSDGPDRPLGEERQKILKEYCALLAAASPVIETCGFDADTLARQKRMLTRAGDFAAAVLRDGKVSASDLEKFCRASRGDILANGAAAARAQIVGMHKQVMAWKKEMTPEEWAGLTVVISGSQTPRVENAAVQYFSRLLGELHGEGRRVVYAESLWDEEKAVNLLGTLRLDGRLSTTVFGDPARMYRDFLADGARTAIDDVLAKP